MLGVKEIHRLQAEYSISDGTFKDAEIGYEAYLGECRTWVRSSLPSDYHELESDVKTNKLQSLTNDFVTKHPSKVRGYITSEGLSDVVRLADDLWDSMSGVSILRHGLDDPTVDEIQINDKNTIFVSRSGVLMPYTDSAGRTLKFHDNDEIHIVLSQLIDDKTGNKPQFTDGRPLLNAKTALHQYRVNAVHHTANSRYKDPYDFPVTTVTLRKFKETKLEIADMIKYGALVPEMGRLLSLLGVAELKMFFVGPTNSGKTTLLNSTALNIPYSKRIIMIQNPTEISFMERDSEGRNKRNVVHHEVVDKGDSNDRYSASMENLISNSYRESPEVIIIGEMRAAKEFYQAQRLMRGGHKIMGTFHAEDALDAIGRYATEISSLGGMSYNEAVKLVSETVNIVVSQYRFPDGRRRVMEITEVLGTDSEGKVLINKLFEYEMSGEMRKNEFGLTEVLGDFKQVGVLSDKTVRSLYKAGISKDDLIEFTDDKNVGRSLSKVV
jgi:pilus assembly protein CpaF